MTTVNLKSDDHAGIFRFLVAVAKSGPAPGFSVDGRVGKDLLKLAAMLPSKSLSAEHQSIADAMFTKKQEGYLSTGRNLAHRCNQLSAAKRRQRAIPGIIDLLREHSAKRFGREQALSVAGTTAH